MISDLVPAVRDHIPLEQGLRPIAAPGVELGRIVRDHIPLEQGLRLHLADMWHRPIGQRPYSIRTRIKTCSAPPKAVLDDESETIFH